MYFISFSRHARRRLSTNSFFLAPLPVPASLLNARDIRTTVISQNLVRSVHSWQGIEWPTIEDGPQKLKFVGRTRPLTLSVLELRRPGKCPTEVAALSSTVSADRPGPHRLIRESFQKLATLLKELFLVKMGIS